jgi:hypothetical protein
MKKQIAVVVGALAFVYMFVPEPTDVVPLLGWLDEGVAGAVLVWALRTLGVTPTSLFSGFAPKTASTQLRDVTPPSN